jgi:carbamate kinase
MAEVRPRIVTDVDAVIDGFGTPDARPIPQATPEQLRQTG